MIQLKNTLRRAVANKKLLLKHLIGLQKEAMIKSIEADQEVYNNLDNYSFLQIYNLYANDSRYYDLFKNASERFPIFSDLITILSQNEKSEAGRYEANPSETSFKRWALRLAVLEYYQELPINVDQKIISTFGGDRLDSTFAPNQKQIYNKWIKYLSQGVKNNIISEEILNAITEKGFGRGSSFEKQLDRYREDFVKQLWYKIGGE